MKSFTREIGRAVSLAFRYQANPTRQALQWTTTPFPSPRRAGHSRRLAGALLGAIGLLLVEISSQAATVTFNFNDGLQGWTQIGTTGRNPWNSGGNAWGQSQAGSIFGYDGDDGANPTYWVRSPWFLIDGSGPLSVRLWGGKANAACAANVADVPANSINGAGFKGVALREVATGNYVKSLSLPDNGNNAVVTLAAEELAAYANDGKRYTLDFLDYDDGGWGWVGLDDVTIPGQLTQLQLGVTNSAVLLGASANITVTIPSNYNATTAVTVYVTNSNPAVLTLNGSAAGAVPVTFAAGGPPSQTVTVAGVSLGRVQLTAGSAGLESSASFLNVRPTLPASGLIGRWLAGPEDLLDKSGSTPAGTHDGLMSGGLTAVFSVDVPPGATGSSLDVATSGGAVLIANTAISDPGYVATFDEGTAQQLSVVCWAKGLPGTWNPFVSKFGEGSTGWQVRRHGGDPVATFTVRGTGGEDDPFNGSTLIDDGAWHHFAATWDGVAGVRKLYVDGKLNALVPHDFGPMGLANVNYLTLGGRSDAGSSDPGAIFSGNLYDVQVYGVALSSSAVQNLFTANTTAVVAYADTPVIDLGKSGSVSVSIPVSANVSAPVTVLVTNRTPAIVSLAGAVGNVVTLTFPTGGMTSQTLTLTGLSEGQAQLDCAAVGLTTASAAVKVYGPHLIGQWFNGTESYANASTFAPAGTHDGSEVGNAGNLTFTTDTPPSKPGKAAQFGGAGGFLIANSSLLDASYASTFDDVIAHQFSVSFWAKGLPGTWNGFISKRGEDAIGWQVRRGGGITEAFTIRGTGSGNEDGVGATQINDGRWHHFAAVWDGWAGTRKCYVDGVLDPSVNLTNDFAPMMMAPNHHLILGAREQSQVSTTPGIEGAFTGSLYDVRMYNYPLSQAEVTDLAFIAAIKVTATQRSLHAPQTMAVNITLPAGANQNKSVSVQVVNNTPAIASLVGAVGNAVTLNYPVGGSVTQQVTVAGIIDGKAQLTASGGGFVAGSGSFNVWADPGSRLIGHWLSGSADLLETSGFRPAGTHDGVAVGGNAAALAFSSDVPPGNSGQSLDLSAGDVAVMITNSATTELGYVETFDDQIANKFSITFWAKGTVPSGDWQPWVSKGGEGDIGFQVRRFGADDPVRPTFTLRGTPGADDPWINTTVDISTWHHYAATWDGTTGFRRLYLDGNPILLVSGDAGPMGLASSDHLTLGAIDTGVFWRFLPTQLYDVRVYSYALTAPEIGAIVTPPTAFSLALDPPSSTIPINETLQLVVTLPSGATATAPVTVLLTNNSPSVVTLVGATGNVLPVTFPVGSLVQLVTLETIGVGQINITGGAVGVGSMTLSTVNLVVAPKLIGHWLAGSQDLKDASGYTPTGTHDGVVVGSNPEALAFSSDVPAGFSGKSLDLTTNASAGISVAVAITNSADSDGAFQPTFDDGISSAFSVALWTKGFPGVWNGFISKRGEDGIGWQVRRHGGDSVETFTIRGAAAGNDDPQGSIPINDGQWHHLAAVWDGLSGTRQCYVDGVLDPQINLAGDFGPMSLAPHHHVALGARESATPGNFEAWFSGKLYDVRIYNYAITPADVRSLVGQVPLSVATGPNQSVILTWPTATGFVLQTSTAVNTGWADATGLTVIDQNGVSTATDTVAGSSKFYRLVQH